MEPNTVAKAEVAADAEVMASVEDGETETFIIADVTTDDAYLTLDLKDAASLPAWR
jgi:histidinol dehydrogenase